LADAKGEQWPLPNVNLVAGQYFVLAAVDKDDAPKEGSSFVPFKLAKADSLSLFHQGQKVDTLVWRDGEAKEGRSFGLLEGKTQTLYPTPGQANAPYGLFFRECLL
jgi:hypothetical protein